MRVHFHVLIFRREEAGYFYRKGELSKVKEELKKLLDGLKVIYNDGFLFDQIKDLQNFDRDLRIGITSFEMGTMLEAMDNLVTRVTEKYDRTIRYK